MGLPEAVAAPRVSPRNAVTQAEPAFIASAQGRALAAMGHQFSEIEEIGAATALEFGRRGYVVAVAEPTRRGGGSAMVVHPVGR
ncbi:hypothetical protein [Thermasporomyces composti]|uniref:hypothetical protein n=1 Tax=Thermasporomyces composti TaxID=696763 RepID=UPI001FE645F2|nr:hypothetical protein [Thermasporomyces composti]